MQSDTQKLLRVLCTGTVLVLLNGTLRQHKTLTIKTLHTQVSLDTERESQVIHSDLDHGVHVKIRTKRMLTLVVFIKSYFIQNLVVDREKMARPTCQQLPRSPVPEVGALHVTSDSCHHTSQQGSHYTELRPKL
jgi:hypothetical protein